jgi:hypothetical protein
VITKATLVGSTSVVVLDAIPLEHFGFAVLGTGDLDLDHAIRLFEYLPDSVVKSQLLGRLVKKHLDVV